MSIRIFDSVRFSYVSGAWVCWFDVNTNGEKLRIVKQTRSRLHAVLLGESIIGTYLTFNDAGKAAAAFYWKKSDTQSAETQTADADTQSASAVVVSGTDAVSLSADDTDTQTAETDSSVCLQMSDADIAAADAAAETVSLSPSLTLSVLTDGRTDDETPALTSVLRDAVVLSVIRSLPSVAASDDIRRRCEAVEKISETFDDIAAHRMLCNATHSVRSLLYGGTNDNRTAAHRMLSDVQFVAGVFVPEQIQQAADAVSRLEQQSVTASDAALRYAAVPALKQAADDICSLYGFTDSCLQLAIDSRQQIHDRDRDFADIVCPVDIAVRILFRCCCALKAMDTTRRSLDKLRQAVTDFAVKLETADAVSAAHTAETADIVSAVSVSSADVLTADCLQSDVFVRMQTFRLRLSAALRRLRLLRQNRRQGRHPDRRTQGQILLSAVGCLRLSVAALCCALKHREILIAYFETAAQKHQHNLSETSRRLLSVSTYKSGGSFSQTCYNSNDKVSLSQGLSALQFDTEVLRQQLLTSAASAVAAAEIAETQMLVLEFTELRSAVLSDCQTKRGSLSGRNDAQNKLLSVLSASCHSSHWQGRQNTHNTVSGINGHLLQEVKRNSVDKYGNTASCPYRQTEFLSADCLRVSRYTVDKQGRRSLRASLKQGQRLLNYANAKTSCYGKLSDAADSLLSGRHADGIGRYAFRLENELNGRLKPSMLATLLLHRLHIIPDYATDTDDTGTVRLPRSVFRQNEYAAGERQHGRTVCSVSTNRLLRLSCRLLRRLSLTAADVRDVDRMSALSLRLRAINKHRQRQMSVIMHDSTAQVTLSVPVVVGHVTLSDDVQGTVSLPVLRVSVETADSQEDTEYFIGGSISEHWERLLCPVAHFGRHSVKVITFHCRSTDSTDTASETLRQRLTSADRLSAVSLSETADDADRLGCLVLLDRLSDNLSRGQQQRKAGVSAAATAAEQRRQQRQQTASVLLRLRRLQTVSVSDSLLSGNCQSGTASFMTGTLRLPSGTQSVSGRYLACLWRNTGYVYNSLFFRCLEYAEQRQQKQQAADAVSVVAAD